jgi:hypothetical protein
MLMSMRAPFVSANKSARVDAQGSAGARKFIKCLHRGHFSDSRLGKPENVIAPMYEQTMVRLLSAGAVSQKG